MCLLGCRGATSRDRQGSALNAAAAILTAGASPGFLRQPTPQRDACCNSLGWNSLDVSGCAPKGPFGSLHRSESLALGEAARLAPQPSQRRRRSFWSRVGVFGVQLTPLAPDAAGGDLSWPRAGGSDRPTAPVAILGGKGCDVSRAASAVGRLLQEHGILQSWHVWSKLRGLSACCWQPEAAACALELPREKRFNARRQPMEAGLLASACWQGRAGGSLGKPPIPRTQAHTHKHTTARTGCGWGLRNRARVIAGAWPSWWQPLPPCCAVGLALLHEWHV